VKASKWDKNEIRLLKSLKQDYKKPLKMTA